MTCPYDPLAAETLDDPFPGYRDLRDRCPVPEYDDFDPPFFTLTRHDDVSDALRDVELWSSRYGFTPQYSSPSGLVGDPPEHTAFRRLFVRGFTPRTVSGLEEEITELATGLVDEMEPLGEGDFHELFASPLPLLVVSRLLGLPSDAVGLFKEMCGALTANYNESDTAGLTAARATLDDYLMQFVEERRSMLASAGVTDPGEEHLGTVVPNDLISGFVVAECDGRRLADKEILWMLVLLLLGGNETTTALLTSLVWRLLQDPDRWEAIKADRSLIEAAIEESLRFDPPVLGMFRTTTRDVDLHGVKIEAKRKVMLGFGSANHDPARWDRPDEFALDRDVDDLKRHLSFGFGHHHCPGAPLARLEARITLGLLLDRLPRLRLVGDTERIAPFLFWGRSRVPVAWT
jgi:cytochrome P450